MRKPCVYILASKRNGTLYTGVTSDLTNRLQQHDSGEIPGFTAQYGVKTLVWFEPHETMAIAIAREKSIKKYPRKWKLNLIERENPNWEALLPY